MYIIYTKGIKVYSSQSGSPLQFGNHGTFRVWSHSTHRAVPSPGKPHEEQGGLFCVYSLLKSEQATPYTHLPRRAHKCDEIRTLVTKIKIDHLGQNGLQLPISSRITAISPLLGTLIVNWKWRVCTWKLGAWGVRASRFPVSREGVCCFGTGLALCPVLCDCSPGGRNFSRSAEKLGRWLGQIASYISP